MVQERRKCETETDREEEYDRERRADAEGDAAWAADGSIRTFGLGLRHGVGNDASVGSAVEPFVAAGQVLKVPGRGAGSVGRCSTVDEWERVMSTGRRVLLIFGILLALPALGLTVAGIGIGAAYAFARDHHGYFSGSLDPVESPAVAVTTSDLDFGTDPGPATVLDRLDVTFRIHAQAVTPSRRLFIGIGRSADVRAYLRGVRVDRVVRVDGQRLVMQARPGAPRVASPLVQDFWIRRAAGPSPTVTWKPKDGHWTVVLMNATGAPGARGVNADLAVGVKAGFLGPLAAILFGLGILLAIVAIVMMVVAVKGSRAPPGADGDLEASPLTAVQPEPAVAEPVALVGVLDPNVSRWQWLVKWFLAIPHYIVLFFLWAALFLLTIVAFFAILFTGRYPRAIFDFNVGVMRWSWRVNFYAAHGGIGTDRYPPFTLHDVPEYPAHLDVAYPEELSRGLVLVKWWLLAIPHYLLIGAVTTGYGRNGTQTFSLITLLVLIAGFALLFTKRYPARLFDLIVGANRWYFRVLAYVLLMTDRYPPFRLDQGGTEPERAFSAPVVPPAPPAAPVS